MFREKIVEQIIAGGVVAVIRLSEKSKLLDIINALSKGGITAMEITMTTPNAVEIIKEFSGQIGQEFILGAGTVLDPETARTVILAGAQFVVSPVTNMEMIKMVHRYDKAVFPGAFTPTEILNAWENGADIVKVFPATALGPQYFKDIHGPLPQIRLTPTGGVSLENTGEFIRCGASCIGVGSALLNKKMIADSDWPSLTENAKRFVEEVMKSRK
ncbi:MAG: bifunctional 4-hydroxy-2-oxoglutarate aldolase/2-dehydro-3-deoxy-phosphogluconate aldolase [Calditrichaceae bacterium]|jgi:2-dehydro-3-deoxyphosphogluconate aldolase / (4S)-4-hydroxy-2-oxoglutarate aldolase